ncbi:PA2169 family four-helix-bundle protein [Dyella sp. BiH032]|uniref:PA2169 family four-helix-bundle protein n=1 Tax=Dyella sp. BiH032 TaxID=3075430 RepID=UPI002892B3E9|nr:PA2169 family four-helix-bundle protein [Dyella sp. BiH032]WNL46829.1 PA2169 family four-helix-bundle protein [Dyella sp. BiH032]
MSHLDQTLFNALIRRGIDDRGLHRRALERVRDPALQILLFENLETLDSLIGDLQAQVRADGGTPAERGTLAGSLRTLAADVSTRFAGHRDAAWVQCLARHECGLLHSFERRVQRTGRRTEAGLNRQLDRLYGMHRDMHCLAGTTHG